MFSHHAILHDALLWLLAAVALSVGIAGLEATAPVAVAMLVGWSNLGLLSRITGGLVADARYGNRGWWGLLLVGKLGLMSGAFFMLLSLAPVPPQDIV